MYSQSPATPDTIPWDWIRNHDKRLARCRLFHQWLGQGHDQPAPRKGLGAAPVLFVIPEKERTKYTALRPAFILPLQWLAGDQPDSAHLPQSLRALAQQVRDQVGVRGWFLDFSEVDGWRGHYDLSDWPIDAVSPDSGFAILATSLLLANAGIELDPRKALATGCPPPEKERVLRQAEYVADKASVAVELSKRTEKPVILFAAAVKGQHDAAKKVAQAQVEAIDLSLPIERSLAGFLAIQIGLRLPMTDAVFSDALWHVLKEETPVNHPIGLQTIEEEIRRRVGKTLAGTPARGENRELASLLGQEQAVQSVLEHIEQQSNPDAPREWLSVQGPAGVGKSTLIRHVLRTEQVCGRFGNNRHFINLSKVPNAERAKELLPDAISQGSFSEPLLLVLDNLEDVLAADTESARQLLFRLSQKNNLCLILTIRRKPESWGRIPVRSPMQPEALTMENISGLFTPSMSDQSLGFLVKTFRGHAQSLCLMANAWNQHQPWTEEDFQEEVKRDSEQMQALGGGNDVSPLALAVSHILNDERFAENTRAGLILAAFTWITRPIMKQAWLESALISNGHHRLEVKRAIALLIEHTLIEKIISPSPEDVGDLMILENHRQALRLLRKTPGNQADFIGCVLLELEKTASSAPEWESLAHDYTRIGCQSQATECRRRADDIRTPISITKNDKTISPKKAHIHDPIEEAYARHMEEEMDRHFQEQAEDAYERQMEEEAGILMAEAAEEEAFLNYGQDIAGQIHLHEEEWDDSAWMSEMADADAEREYWADYADAVVNDELWDLYDKDDCDSQDDENES